MKFEFTLNENDYLTSSLFTASKSPIIKKRRLWSRLIIPIVYVGLGIWFWDEYNMFSSILFFAFALVWFLISPMMTKRRFTRYYKSAIKEAYGQRFGRMSKLEIENDVLIFTEEPNEGRFQAADIDVINELSNWILIRLKTGNSIIIPKDKIKEVEILKKQLKELAERLKLTYNTDLNWKWR